MEEEKFDFEKFEGLSEGLSNMSILYTKLPRTFLKRKNVLFNRPIQTCIHINLLKHRRRK